MIKKLVLCKLLKKHDFYYIEKLSVNADKIGCKRCGKEWAMNHDLKALCEWDEEFEIFYNDFDSLLKFHKRKRSVNNES